MTNQTTITMAEMTNNEVEVIVHVAGTGTSIKVLDDQKAAELARLITDFLAKNAN